MSKKFYVGAMSGTSHDAVDVSIIEINSGFPGLPLYKTS